MLSIDTVMFFVKQGQGVKKHRGPKPPMPKTRFSRNASDYDLHEMAGGLPLPTLAAPNVRTMS